VSSTLSDTKSDTDGPVEHRGKMTDPQEATLQPIKDPGLVNPQNATSGHGLSHRDVKVKVVT
jgi:hypothetical protein